MTDDDDIAELLAERKARQAQTWALMAHPDSRDPDYPEYDEGDGE